MESMETKTETVTQEREPVRPQRTAVIVGASSGIGKETALKLATRGYRTFNVSRTPLKGERVRTVTADAAQEGELSKAIHGIGEECGGIDLLIYSAGFSMTAPLEYAKSGDYRYLFEVNYFGAIEALRAATPYLKKRGGRVVFVGSIGGDMPVPYDSFYSSSKAALCMLAREADVELRSRGVRVSALLPGGTATDFTYSRRVYGEEESMGYAPSVKRASAALANIEQGGMSPSLVAEAIIKLAEKKNPPPVAVAGGMNGFTRYMYKLLPERVTDWWIRKKFNQK
ncbi:MAG: SDR family NAD(P)-dependent oxidoreductase [Clostridia bacterium]|nr:SDR family NAD(P)-dependent oxidoreductase [Clostridia bacterium]